MIGDQPAAGAPSGHPIARGTRIPACALACYALAFFALPIGRSAELFVVLGAIAALVYAARARTAWPPRATALLLAVYACYWAPMLLSSFDAIDARTALAESAVDLRFLPFAALALVATRVDAAWLAKLRTLVAVILAAWTLDALVQAATGYSVGGRLEVDRVSGVFGNDNLKLGPVLACFSPFLLVEAHVRRGWRAAAIAGIAIGAAVLLAGSRASWLVYAIVVLALAWRYAPRPRDFALATLAIAALAIAGGVAAYHASDRFEARIDRTLAGLAGTEQGIDHALAFRLPIWNAAARMALDHPLNGVGVRGYRHAYPAYAANDDRFVDAERRIGAYHPHQLMLELASEMGVIALLAWVLAAALLVRAWRRASEASRDAALAPGLALAATLFPLNTHPAFYSSFWALVLWWLLALYLAAIARDA